jgi:hypothetical protein
LRVSFLLVLLVACAGGGSAGAADTPEESPQGIVPEWIQGFPLRAGSMAVVMWSPLPGATEYRLLKQMGDGGFAEVYRGALNSYNDPDAPQVRKIAYKVVGVVGGKETGPSPTAELEGMEPLKPPAFTGSLIASNAITLLWTVPSGSMFFNLYRAESKDGPFELLGSIQQQSYTDRKVSKGKVYHYRVSAVDRLNAESEKSESVEATLPESRSVASDGPVLVKPVPKGDFRGSELDELDQPAVLGWTRSGELFVVDRVGIKLFDKDGRPSARIRFGKDWTVPSGCTLDQDGNYLLAFYGEQVVRKVDENGKLMWEAGYPLAEGKPANNPNYAVPDADGGYWITDGVRYQLLKGVLEKEGFRIVASIGRVSGGYDAATRLQTDLPGVFKAVSNPNDGYLYALLGPYVKVLDPKSGRLVRQFGGFGLENDRFQQVGDIFFKKDGGFLVLDPLMNQIKEFDRGYAYVATYANEVAPGRIKLSADFSSAFTYDEGLGRIYLASAMGNRVYMFDVVK